MKFKLPYYLSRWRAVQPRHIPLCGRCQPVLSCNLRVVYNFYNCTNDLRIDLSTRMIIHLTQNSEVILLKLWPELSDSEWHRVKNCWASAWIQVAILLHGKNDITLSIREPFKKKNHFFVTNVKPPLTPPPSRVTKNHPLFSPEKHFLRS